VSEVTVTKRLGPSDLGITKNGGEGITRFQVIVADRVIRAGAAPAQAGVP